MTEVIPSTQATSLGIEEREPVGKAFAHDTERQRRRSGRGRRDGEGETVEAGDDIGYIGGIGVAGQCATGLRQAHRKEPDRRRLEQWLDAVRRPAGTLRGRRAKRRSPDTRSGSRLVASTRTPAPAPSSDRLRRAASSGVCSHASSTTSRVERLSAAPTVAARSPDPAQLIPSTRASSADRSFPGWRPVRATSQAPSGRWSRRTWAAAVATRVLPTHPGP